MRNFSTLSRPEEFQAEYRRLSVIINGLWIESENESKSPITTLTESCTQLKHLIKIFAATLDALNAWKETLQQEKDLLHPPRTRVTEIETDIAKITEKMSLLQNTKKREEIALSVASICLASDHHQHQPDDHSSDTDEGKSASLVFSFK